MLLLQLKRSQSTVRSEAASAMTNPVVPQTPQQPLWIHTTTALSCRWQTLLSIPLLMSWYTMDKPCRYSYTHSAYATLLLESSGRSLSALTTVYHLIQVLGLTNYSHWKEAGPVRQCLQDSPVTQKLLSSLAIKQLQRFVHVGVMDMLDESIEALAVCLWLQCLVLYTCPSYLHAWTRMVQGNSCIRRFGLKMHVSTYPSP